MSSPSRSLPLFKMALSSNEIVVLICGGCAIFILFVAIFCDALMRSDAAMTAVGRPGICLVPPKPTKLTKPASSSASR